MVTLWKNHEREFTIVGFSVSRITHRASCPAIVFHFCCGDTALLQKSCKWPMAHQVIVAGWSSEFPDEILPLQTKLNLK